MSAFDKPSIYPNSGGFYDSASQANNRSSLAATANTPLGVSLQDGENALLGDLMDPYGFDKSGLGNVQTGMQSPSAFGSIGGMGMLGKDGWFNPLVSAGLGVASYLDTKKVNKQTMKGNKYALNRQKKEDTDYDAFKNSWGAGGGTNASSVQPPQVLG